MKKERSDLGMIALIAGAGAVGALATMFAVVATRWPVATPPPPLPPDQIETGQKAVEELSERVITETVTREGTTIRIRGSASLRMRAQPVIYIDGVRVKDDRDEALRQLSSDQIDRVEVLKGDAAKEHYGSEARNGVIQIVTKSREGS